MFTRKLLQIVKDHKLARVRKLSALNPEKQKLYKMQAWQIHSYGDLSELQLTQARCPYISDPYDLLIKVHAASVNPIDTYMIRGYGRTMFSLMRWNELEFPLTLGRDFAGTIVDKGHHVNSKFKVGDNVYGFIPLHKQGSHAESVIANESNILLQPKHLSAIEATSLIYAGLTAWSALFVTGELLVKDIEKAKILILGASGGVGTVAVQMLKSQKALVFATCSTDAVPLVRSLGANQVFDYKSSNYEQAVAEVGRYDIILDCAKIGYERISKLWLYNKYITLNGSLLMDTDKYGLIGGLASSVGNLFGANIKNCYEGKSVRWAFFLPFKYGLEFVDNLIRNEQILPVIHKTFPFEELPKAYETLVAGHLRGKVVIDMQNSS